jgi:molybdopterin-guanine dinucleotide biosynthesis protein A
MVGVPPVNGLVLAGGQSIRMGSDKAAMLYRGQPLLNRAVALLTSELEDVRVSVRTDQVDDVIRGRHDLIEDQLEDIGPAAGILSAHMACTDCAWLVIACDMPLLNEIVIRDLVAARDPGIDATAWASAEDGAPEPLCTIYEPGTLAAFLTQVRSGASASPSAWLTKVRVRLLDSPGPDVFKSANTQAELEQMTGAAGLPSGVSQYDKYE